MERGAGEPEAGYAVLVPIVEHDGIPCILLTKRLDTLPEYSGHVSFPGGARDPGDRDLAATAVRETFEEVGISPERIEVLRELPPRTTELGHRVQPYLARVKAGPVTANPLEVDRLVFLPVSLLSGRDPFGTRTWMDPRGVTRNTYTLIHEGLEIWGLTARILQGCCAEALFKKGTDYSFRK